MGSASDEARLVDACIIGVDHLLERVRDDDGDFGVAFAHVSFLGVSLPDIGSLTPLHASRKWARRDLGTLHDRRGPDSVALAEARRASGAGQVLCDVTGVEPASVGEVRLVQAGDQDPQAARVCGMSNLRAEGQASRLVA